MILLLIGCTYDTVESACSDRLPGGGSAAAEDFVGRVNCYRRLTGVSLGRMDPAISDAALAHARYFQEHYTYGWYVSGEATYTLLDEETGEPVRDWDAEDPGRERFTGENLNKRLDAHGYTETNVDWGKWQLYFSYEDVGDVPTWVDRLMAHFLYREALMSPGWYEAGFGKADPFGQFVLLRESPDKHLVGRPVTYPADGQVGVPPNYEHYPEGSSIEDDPLGFDEDLGLPITMLTTGDSGARNSNPYELVVDEARLVGPDGEVEVVVIDPDDLEKLLYTVAMVPTAPLEEQTTYTATIAVTNQAGSFEETWSFRTGRTRDWQYPDRTYQRDTGL